MSDPRTRPLLRQNQVALLVVERNTGIVLTKGGDRYIGQDEDCYRIFDSAAAAITFANELVRDHPDREATIWDGSDLIVYLARSKS